MPETGAKWTQEKLTDLQFLVETGGSCKIQLQNSPEISQHCRLTYRKGALCFLYPEDIWVGGDVAIRVEGSVRFAN